MEYGAGRNVACDHRAACAAGQALLVVAVCEWKDDEGHQPTRLFGDLNHWQPDHGLSPHGKLAGADDYAA
jgi:hypothetical protein